MTGFTSQHKRHIHIRFFQKDNIITLLLSKIYFAAATTHGHEYEKRDKIHERIKMPSFSSQN